MHNNSLRVVCIVVVQLFAIACSKVSFYGTTETGRNFVDGMAADAGGRKDAILRNLPKNPSNTQVLDVFVDNISNYKYALVVGKTDCTDAAYSKPINYLEHIRDDLGADGEKGLCVVGVQGDVAVQSSPTQYFWTKDTVAPGPFAISAIDSLLKQSPASISWSISEGVATYSASIGPKKDCTSPTIKVSDIKAESLSIDALADGQYFICAEAQDLAGNKTSATNNGLAFSIDSLAPSAFSINKPTSRIRNTKPEIAWSPSSSDAVYDVIVASDNACTQVVESAVGLVDPHYNVAAALPDQSYYVCVKARDPVGHETLAANNGYMFTVDTVGVFVTFDENTKPANPSNVTQLNVTVLGPDVVKYRYKIGSGALTSAVFCADATGYLAEADITTRITASLVGPPPLGGYADGPMIVCAYGADLAGNWTRPDGSIPYNSFEWTKSVAAPSITFTLKEFCGPRLCLPNAPLLLESGTIARSPNAGISGVGVSVQDLGTQRYLATAAGAFNAVTPVLFPATVSGNQTTFSYGFSVANLRNGITYKVTATVVDIAGNHSSVSHDITWDSVAPSVSPVMVKTREPGAQFSDIQTTKVNFVTVSVAGNGTGSPIEKYCLKMHSNIDPVGIADPCWTTLALTEQQKLFSKNNLDGRVPFTPGQYKFYAWILDMSGNQSAAAPFATVNYQPILPPALSHLYVTYDPLEPLPTPSNTLSVNNNRIVYIRWVVSTTNPNGLKNSPKPIKIFYMRNGEPDEDLGVNLDAGSKNAVACVLSTPNPPPSNSFSGCYQWTIPGSVVVNEYLRFRIQAVDADDMLAFGQTNALHLPQFNFLAGNTETGLEGTSTAAILDPVGTQNLVVHPSGRVFILDSRGLLVVDPLDGILRKFIDKAQLTVSVGKLALDPRGNLLIYNGDSIKQVSNVDILAGLSNMTTVIGGGSKTDDTVAAPLELSMQYNGKSESLFFVAPNGDIYFQSDYQNRTSVDGARIRRAVAPSFQVESIKIAGTATPWADRRPPAEPDPGERPASYEIEHCRLWSAAFTFDPVTKRPVAMFPLLVPDGKTAADSPCWHNIPGKSFDSYFDFVRFNASGSGFTLAPSTPTPTTPTRLAYFGLGLGGAREGNYVKYFQSLSGQLYARVNGVGVQNDHVFRYNSSDQVNPWKLLAGQDNGGECLDGTRQALDCALNLSSIFVDAQDNLYMMDNDVVRIIQSDGTMLTIVGQSKSSGDGKNPLNARFDQIGAFDFYPKTSSDPKFVVSDAGGFRLREFKENTSIDSIAGDGVSLAKSPLGLAKDNSLSWGNDAPNAAFKLSETGDVFVMKYQGEVPFKIDRANGMWKALSDSPGIPGSGYGAQVLAMHPGQGMRPGQLLFGTFNYLRGLTDTGNGRLYEHSDSYLIGNRPTLVVSKPGADSPLTTFFPFENDTTVKQCPAGVSRLDCNGPATGTGVMPQGTYDTAYNAWVIAINSVATYRIVGFQTQADDKIFDILNLPRPVRSFAITGAGATKRAYVCLGDGYIYKYMLRVPALPDVAVGTKIAFPVTGMTCSKTSGSMIYSTARGPTPGTTPEDGTLIFGYELNGLQGIAEFVNP